MQQPHAQPSLFSSPTSSSFATKCQEPTAACIGWPSLPVWCVFIAISLLRSLIDLVLTLTQLSDSYIIMPRSGRSQAQILHTAEATKKALAESVDISSQNLLEEYKQQLEKATDKIRYLESELEAKCLYCSKLVSKLENVQKMAEELSSELHRVKLQAEEQYKKLRVEHRARQRGQARKGVLLEQIRLLKSANRERSEDYESSSSKAIDSLLKLEKENSKLQSELSRCLERLQAEFGHSQEKLLSLGNKLKESKHLASNFKKQRDRAVLRRDRAVTKAREQVQKEHTTHNLLSKGVYTEATRNLIRLLVKAGCSRGYVGEIIQAVLKSAGITAIGNVSRTTVSRVITEGYYAAQIQLAYEMQNAEGIEFDYLKLIYTS